MNLLLLRFFALQRKPKKERDVETRIINNQFSNSIFSIHSPESIIHSLSLDTVKTI